MKKLLCVLVVVLLFPFQVQTAPFLVSSPLADPTQADTCAVQEGTVVTRTPLVSGACHADLSAEAAGTHSLTVWFESSVWGTASATVPFSFSRPTAGGTGPTGLGISVK